MMNQGSNQNSNRTPRNANNARSNKNKGNKNRNRNGQSNNNNTSNSNKNGNKTNTRIPYEIWKNMSQEEKDAHYKRIGFKPGAKTGKTNNGAPHYTKVKFGPNTTRIINNTNQWDNSDDDNDDEPMLQGTIAAQINIIMNSVRHSKVAMYHKVFQGVPMALMDNGADTCLLSPEFYIEFQSTDHLIDM